MAFPLSKCSSITNCVLSPGLVFPKSLFFPWLYLLAEIGCFLCVEDSSLPPIVAFRNLFTFFSKEKYNFCRFVSTHHWDLRKKSFILLRIAPSSPISPQCFWAVAGRFLENMAGHKTDSYWQEWPPEIYLKNRGLYCYTDSLYFPLWILQSPYLSSIRSTIFFSEFPNECCSGWVNSISNGQKIHLDSVCPPHPKVVPLICTHTSQMAVWTKWVANHQTPQDKGWGSKEKKTLPFYGFS